MSNTGLFRDQRVHAALRLIVDRPQLNSVVYDGLGAIGNDVFGRFDPLTTTACRRRRILARPSH